VVEYTTGEPYYSIEWFDPAKNEYRLGYSSYCIDNVAAWLAEYFEIVEKPKTNADRIRAMSDEELMQFLFNEVSNNTICSFCVPTMRTKCKCDGHCKNGILEWLKQPAEE
jgi:hypothetical protein